MKNLNWHKKGIIVDGNHLSNLRFADDIAIFSESSDQLEEMTKELNDASNKIGLCLNTSKTKVITNSSRNPITVQDSNIEYVDSYIYLGKEISFKKSRNEDEVARRVNITWNKFWSHKEVLKSSLPIKLKKKVMDTCLLPCLTYGCQTWNYNSATCHKIQTCQRAMERSILNIKLKDRQRCESIRIKTNVIDALSHSKSQKWKWAGHVARTSNSKWSKRTTQWSGPKGIRKRGRPKERWSDEIVRIAGVNWVNKAQNRQEWHQMEEAFTRKGSLVTTQPT